MDMREWVLYDEVNQYIDRLPVVVYSYIHLIQTFAWALCEVFMLHAKATQLHEFSFFYFIVYFAAIMRKKNIV